MKQYFINFSNHESVCWNAKQIASAMVYGEIVDIPFPQVDPMWTEDDIKEIGTEYLEKIMAYQPAAVMCQGEFSVAYYVVSHLKKRGITVVTACSKRNTVVNGNEKISRFEFEKFREYIE